MKKDMLAANGHTLYQANKWYYGLEMHGNTSINPFFYGTYLDETKPGEPVTRTKNQAFQADAVGVAHQLTPAHFNRTHTFRVEWQPGDGGRIDWFTKGHRINETFSMVGDGNGEDWVHVYGIKDKILKETMGSHIPIEPTYLIFNTAVSSTWGFPYDVEESCEKCYDCNDPTCACAFYAGFCEMLRSSDVAMLIDSVRVYQSKDPSAHVGANHTVGCDPPDYPTRGWIKGHSYRYMRNAPFSYDDKSPLKKSVQKGGGSCLQDKDCGANIQRVNLTAVYESSEAERKLEGKKPPPPVGRGKCIKSSDFNGMFATKDASPKVCKCNPGFTGPHCLAEEHIDDTLSAFEENAKKSPFMSISNFYVTPFMLFLVGALFLQMVAVSCVVTTKRKKINADAKNASTTPKRSVFKMTVEDRSVSGTSI